MLSGHIQYFVRNMADRQASFVYGVVAVVQAMILIKIEVLRTLHHLQPDAIKPRI